MTLVWPSDWLSQNAAVNSLLNRIEIVDREVSPAAYINTVEPADDADLDTAWVLKKGAGSQTPENSKTHWYNPETGRIENIFVRVGEISPFSQPLIAREQTSGVELITSTFVTAALGAQAALAVTPTKSYDSIHIIGQLRSNTAAASTSLLLRFNTLATAIYKTLIHRVITATTFDRVVLTDQTSAFTTNMLIPAAAGNTPRNVYTSFRFDFYFPSRKAHCFSQWAAYVDDGGASEQQVCSAATSANSVSAITSINLTLTAGSFDLGSWIAAYGIHPVT